MAPKRIARPFNYPKDDEDRATFRETTLRGNKDILFHYTSDDGKCYLTLYSTLLREWLSAMKRQYPELQETQQDGMITLESEEGIIHLYPSAKVLVYGQQLMEWFERDFPQMKQRVRPGSNNAGNGALPFVYPERSTDYRKQQIRQRTLNDNHDTLYFNTAVRKSVATKCSLTFFSTLVEKWLNAMKQQYSELQESTQDNMIKLKSDEGTILLYPVLIVEVEGQLMERFERDFPQMKQEVQSADLLAAMGGLNINNEEEQPAEPEGEDTLDTPPNPTNR